MNVSSHQGPVGSPLLTGQMRRPATLRPACIAAASAPNPSGGSPRSGPSAPDKRGRGRPRTTRMFRRQRDERAQDGFRDARIKRRAESFGEIIGAGLCWICDRKSSRPLGSVPSKGRIEARPTCSCKKWNSTAIRFMGRKCQAALDLHAGFRRVLYEAMTLAHPYALLRDCPGYPKPDRNRRERRVRRHERNHANPLSQVLLTGAKA